MRGLSDMVWMRRNQTNTPQIAGVRIAQRSYF
jgi:hypothetical protein